jgi:hypothetical protein
MPKAKAKKSQKELNKKMVVVDEDYRPEGANLKKKSSMKQIENRNIVPNVVRLIISFIQKKVKSERIVEKLFKKWGCPESYSLKRYYMYQGMVKNLLSNYVNEETLGFLVGLHQGLLDIFDSSEQQFYNKITRTIIAHFIQEEFYLSVLTSRRMEEGKKYLHLAALRNIRRTLKTLLGAPTTHH